MPRLLVLSDLHIEFGNLRLPKDLDADAALLSGDTHIWTNAVIWADELARRYGFQVVMIAGNHEPYRNPKKRGRDLPATIAALRARASQTEGRVTFLEKETAVVAGIRFIGCTLRTDWNLFGDPEGAMAKARLNLNDYRGTTDAEPGVRYDPLHALDDHRAARVFLDAALADARSAGRTAETGQAVPTVVATHHAPSARSLPETFATDPLSAGYASHLDDLVAGSGADLWVHGHIHTSSDYRIGGTRVLCNPRGYHGHEVNRRFDLGLIVEL